MRKTKLTAIILAFGATLSLNAQLKQADVITGNNGKIVITWEYAEKETPVDIYWANSPEDAINKGKLIAKGVKGTSFAMYAPDAKVQSLHEPITDKRVYYALKTAKGNPIITAERKIDRFDNVSKMSNFKPVNNFRDIGGYMNKDAQHVKWGKFYRSNELSTLTDKEVEFVEDLGVGTIFDLRGAKEVKNYPNVDINAETVYFDEPSETNQGVNSKNPQERLKMWGTFSSDGTNVFDIMIASNKKYVDDYIPLYRNMFDILVNKKPGTPIIGHCAGGKDRTGAMFAVILSALDVPRETIIEDYLLTGVYRQLEDDIELNYVKGLNNLSDDEVKLVDPAWRAYPEYINTFFSTVEQKYGSMDSYLEKQCGLTPEMKAKLKNLYLDK